MKKFLSVVFFSILLMITFTFSDSNKICVAATSVEDKLASSIGEYDGYYTYSGGKVGMNLKIYKASNGQYKGTLNTYRITTSAIIGTYDLNVSYDEKSSNYLILKGNKITKGSPATSIYLEGHTYVVALVVESIDKFGNRTPMPSHPIFEGNLVVNNKTYPFSMTKK